MIWEAEIVGYFIGLVFEKACCGARQIVHLERRVWGRARAEGVLHSIAYYSTIS